MRDHPTAGCDALNVVMLVQVQFPQLGMPNVENQMTKDARSSNDEARRLFFGYSDFVLLSSFRFRHSIFQAAGAGLEPT